MIIKLVSFPYWDPNKEHLTTKQRNLRISVASKILNEKDTDFVMFSEWIFYTPKDLDAVCQSVHNKKVTALFELALPGDLEGNHLYLLQNGKIKDLKTCQIFCESKEATKENIERLIVELEHNKCFTVNGKRFLVFQCGENLILKTQRDEKNKAVFRLQDRELKKRFDKILNEADVILNPVHQRWKRFYDLSCRLFKFSEQNRYCFYCTQLEGNMLDNAHKNPDKNSAQRAMKSRRILKPINPDNNSQDYLLQAYEI